MQTTSLLFRQHAAGHFRPISWQLRASFDKTFDPSVTFFELDTSLLDGVDVLAPSDGEVVQEWDKYAYVDYSDRVISMETTRQVSEPYSIVQSYADVVMNNYDGYFTPNGGSPIENFILPKRPFRLFMGFGGQTVPVFVGLSEKMPTLNKSDRTVTFHLIDFLSVIFEKTIVNSQMLLDASTSEILDELFQQAGLTSSQYDLDPSFNRVPFFYVKKGDKVGTIIQELMEAEQGRLYLDETGIIKFRNRQNYNTSPVITFNKSNTVDYSISAEDDIINYAKITVEILAVQAEQSIWAQSGATYVAAGATVVIFADLNDPATSVTTPVYSAEAIQSSHFITTQDPEATVPYTDIGLTDIDVFSTAVKLTFENTGSLNGYVAAIDLWGTPVKVEDTIIVEEKDQTSIDNFEERRYELVTRYIQTRNNAVSKASVIVDDYKDFGSIVDIDVKGTPALQIDDVADLTLDGYDGNYVISRIVNTLTMGHFAQRLTAKEKELRTYFILDQSLLDGTDDVLSP